VKVLLTTRVWQTAAAVLLGAAFVSFVTASGDSALTRAVKAGDRGAVRDLIASGADVNARSGDGSTPLLWAAHANDVETARALIGAGARVEEANDYGITPLLEAARTGDAAMVDLLLLSGADPAHAHPEGETPLMAAARAGSVPTARLLLARGADVNAADGYQQATALMWAAAEGHLDVVDLLLEAGADPNRQAHVNPLTERHNADFPTGGFTALMWAARRGDEAMVRRLVAGGADVNLKNGDEASAAMIAIYNDRFDLAATLVDLGSDVRDGSLYVAVEMRDATTDQFAFDGSRRRPDHPNELSALDLMRLLLERGADPNQTFTGQLHSASMPNTDRFDNTPFFRAAIAADVEALKLLIAYGVDLEQTPPAPPPAASEPTEDPPAGRGRGNPNAGRTAAMVAMRGGRGPGMTGGPAYIREGPAPYREPGSRKPEEALALLLDAGANPNAKGPDGATLLHQAARAGNLEMIRALADAGVDFSQPNADGFTALDVAEGKRPAGAGRGRGDGPPPLFGRGRGRGASQQEVAKLLRELMGLPPAPAPVAPSADSTDSAADQGDGQ
jgi:ankyrin repeat protein